MTRISRTEVAITELRGRERRTSSSAMSAARRARSGSAALHTRTTSSESGAAAAAGGAAGAACEESAEAPQGDDIAKAVAVVAGRGGRALSGCELGVFGALCVSVCARVSACA